MIVMFGNLTIEQFEKRTGWNFSEEDRKWLEEHRQDNATVRSDSERFHIFDLPFLICVSPIIKDEMIRRLTAYGASKECVQLCEAEETPEEKREKEIKAENEAFEAKKNDPCLRWIKKWVLSAPLGDMEYRCFINTEHVGYRNIPSEISGFFSVYRDSEGLHGRFTLDTPDESRYPEWNYVVGLGMYKNGDLIHNNDDFHFEGRIEEHRVPERDTVMIDG